MRKFRKTLFCGHGLHRAFKKLLFFERRNEITAENGVFLFLRGKPRKNVQKNYDGLTEWRTVCAIRGHSVRKVRRRWTLVNKS